LYGKSLYGLEKYGYETAQDGQSEYFIDLASYAPSFLAEIRELAEIYRTEGYTVGQMQHDLEEVWNQCFVDTATWGLLYWEAEYGITTNLLLSYEERRKIIKNKIRSSGTSTVQMIKNAAETFGGGEVEIIEDAANYRFIVRFVGIKGIPRNMQALITMLEDVKPAHLAYEFEYTYTAWEDLKPYTWGDIKAFTWAGIRSLKTVSTGGETWGSLKSETWGKVFWRTWEDLKY